MLKYNGIPFEPKYKPDGSFDLKVNPYVISSKHIIIWEYENDEEMLVLYYLVNHIKSKSRNPIHLILPYVPYSECDFVDSDHIFILKYFCNFVNSLGLEKIRILDPYSNVCAALLNNVEIIDVMPYINLACEKTHSDHLKVLFLNDRVKNKYYDRIGKNMIYSFNVQPKDEILIVTDYIYNFREIGEMIKDLINKGVTSIFVYATHIKNFETEYNKGILENANKFFTPNLIGSANNKIETIKEINNANF